LRASVREQVGWSSGYIGKVRLGSDSF
jgi:hypothetical protein